jgi:hypothetical protein
MREIEFTRLTDFGINLTFSNVPEGRTVAKAYVMLKDKKHDADADAVLSASTESISDNEATVQLTDTDTDIDPGDYWFAVKVILDNGDAIATDAYGKARILPAIVNATS